MTDSASEYGTDAVTFKRQVSYGSEELHRLLMQILETTHSRADT